MSKSKGRADRGRQRFPIPDQLRGIIRARGLTAYELARQVETAPSVITRFLNGERGLTLDTFDRIADALNLKLVEGPRPAARTPAPARPAPRTPAMAPLPFPDVEPASPGRTAEADVDGDPEATWGPVR